MEIVEDYDEWIKVANDMSIIVYPAGNCFFAVLDDQYQTMVGTYCGNRGYLDLDRIKRHYYGHKVYL